MLKVIYGILITMILALLIMFGGLFINPKHQEEEQVTLDNPKYHLQFIVQDKNESFWSDLEKGAKAAEKELGVYVELVTLEQMDIESLSKTVEMAINSGVDGIALQAVDSEKTQELIDIAKSQGIAILTYENNNYILSDTPTVGTNNYSLGTYAGEMAVEAANGQADVAVVINNSGNEGDKEFKNLIIEGINNAFDSYSSMHISEDNIYTIDTDMFEAEKVTSSIIEKPDMPNLIICMDAKCTSGIAQIIRDNNLVGDIKIVGYGVSPQTLDFIEHGVIYGTISPDSFEIGYSTVKSLTQLLEGEQISNVISTSLHTIDKSNAAEYSEDIVTE